MDTNGTGIAIVRPTRERPGRIEIMDAWSVEIDADDMQALGLAIERYATNLAPWLDEMGKDIPDAMSYVWTVPGDNADTLHRVSLGESVESDAIPPRHILWIGRLAMEPETGGGVVGIACTAEKLEEIGISMQSAAAGTATAPDRVMIPVYRTNRPARQTRALSRRMPSQ